VTSAGSAAAGPRDLVVVSDLHLGRGQNAATKRWHRLEAFLYDEDFRAFCGWLCQQQAERGAPLALVLNGDTFDLLRIEPPTSAPAGLRRIIWPQVTPAVAAGMVRDILAGHAAVVEGLAGTARVITSAALIMVAVFCAFLLNGSPTIKQFGLGMAAAVAIDATLIRCVLVPAILALLGPATWWMPRWLARITPPLSIEGEAWFEGRETAEPTEQTPTTRAPHPTPIPRGTRPQPVPAADKTA
jgi:hypothetical protein